MRMLPEETYGERVGRGCMPDPERVCAGQNGDPRPSVNPESRGGSYKTLGIFAEMPVRLMWRQLRMCLASLQTCAYHMVSCTV